MITHMQLANSTTMAVLCSITILVVLIQPILFVRLALRRARQLGIPKEEIKATAQSSAIFSIIPSLPIVVSYLMLVPLLGRYFPWLRLSVVGSAVYETMIADMAARAFGLESISISHIPLDTFIGILFIVSIGILGGNIFNLLFLKSFDKGLEKLKKMNMALVPIVTGGMFLGLYGTMAAPYLINVENIPCMVAIFGAGIAALLLSHLSKDRPRLRDFSFPISMLTGMLLCCLYSAWIG